MGLDNAIDDIAYFTLYCADNTDIFSNDERTMWEGVNIVKEIYRAFDEHCDPKVREMGEGWEDRAEAFIEAYIKEHLSEYVIGFDEIQKLQDDVVDTVVKNLIPEKSLAD